MMFLCTFAGMVASLLIWVALYNYFVDSDNAALNAIAPSFEAISVGGIGLFVILSVALSALTYYVLTRGHKK